MILIKEIKKRLLPQTDVDLAIAVMYCQFAPSLDPQYLVLTAL